MRLGQANEKAGLSLVPALAFHYLCPRNETMNSLRPALLVRHAALLLGLLSMLLAGSLPHHHHGRVPCVAEASCGAGHTAGGLHSPHCAHHGAAAHAACDAHAPFVRPSAVRMLGAGLGVAVPLWLALCAVCAALLPRSLGGRCPRGASRFVVPLPSGVCASGGWRAPPVVC